MTSRLFWFLSILACLLLLRFFVDHPRMRATAAMGHNRGIPLPVQNEVGKSETGRDWA